MIPFYIFAPNGNDALLTISGFMTRLPGRGRITELLLSLTNGERVISTHCQAWFFCFFFFGGGFAPLFQMWTNSLNAKNKYTPMSHWLRTFNPALVKLVNYLRMNTNYKFWLEKEMKPVTMLWDPRQPNSTLLGTPSGASTSVTKRSGVLVSRACSVPAQGSLCEGYVIHVWYNAYINTPAQH